MNGSCSQVEELTSKIKAQISNMSSDKCEIIICPPFLYLDRVLASLAKTQFALGAQDASAYTNGAYTGQVSASMLADLGCRFVIIGHSERRQFCFEDNDTLVQKLSLAVESGLTPIFCVGETAWEREQNKTETIISQQLGPMLSQCGVSVFSKCIVAYEPVWAIGTGKTATPEEAQAVHAYIRSLLSESNSILSELPILYGGSVNAENAQALFSQPDIDGGLIGGASLKADQFAKICDIAQKV